LVVRLDRPVPPPFEPAPLGTAAVGMALHVAGFPTGLPMKSVDGCTVRSHVSGTDAYRIDCDLFAGSSGSGIFDDAGALLGVYTQGAGDYRPRGPGECSVALVLTQDGMLSSGVGTPQLGAFLPVAPAIEALCAAGHPSPLCGLAAACGDGVCSFGETTASCSDDCAPPTCGDEVCSPGEDFDCAVDCGARDRVAECSATTDAGAIPDAGAITTDAGDDAAPDAGAPAAAPSCAASRGYGRSAAWMALAMLALGTSSSLVRSRARSVASKRHSDARRSAPAPHPRVAR
jgi:hypothetical protein